MGSAMRKFITGDGPRRPGPRGQQELEELRRVVSTYLTTALQPASGTGLGLRSEADPGP